MQVTRAAIESAEQNGIVFIDEVDKIVTSSGQDSELLCQCASWKSALSYMKALFHPPYLIEQCFWVQCQVY